VSFQDGAVGHTGRVVLDRLQLDLPRGSFHALLGANGSGKTTLLKTLAGILPPLAGTLRRQLPDLSEPVLGYVPQRESLDPVFLFNSYEVVLMGACGRVGPGRFYPVREKEWAHECLRRVDADDLARRRFSTLSGGQKQRVLIARALVTRPHLLLLDEPTTGLDPSASQALMDLLQALHQNQQLTVLMVSHDLQAVRRHIKDLLWIHEGRLLQGTCETLLEPTHVNELLHLQLP